MVPPSSLMRTAPGCGKNLPPAVLGRERKKLGFSLARSPSSRLDVLNATAPQAFPSATSTRNMLAPSSRCADLIFPESSTTTTAIGRYPSSLERSNAASIMWLARLSVRPEISAPYRCVGVVAGRLGRPLTPTLGKISDKSQAHSGTRRLWPATSTRLQVDGMAKAGSCGAMVPNMARIVSLLNRMPDSVPIMAIQ